jgi:hypothetical protein
MSRFALKELVLDHRFIKTKPGDCVIATSLCDDVNGPDSVDKEAAVAVIAVSRFKSKGLNIRNNEFVFVQIVCDFNPDLINGCALILSLENSNTTSLVETL